jgi:hypothetical protein
MLEVGFLDEPEGCSARRSEYAIMRLVTTYGRPILHNLQQWDGTAGWWSVHVRYAAPDGTTGCLRLAHEATDDQAWAAAQDAARALGEGHVWLDGQPLPLFAAFWMPGEAHLFTTKIEE